MKGNLQRFGLLTAVAVGTSLVSTLPLSALAGPQDRDDHARATDQQRDWSNNSYYSMGQREGEADRSQNRQRHHKHHFKRDEDRQAYESGYQTSWNRTSDQRHDDNQRHDDDHPHQ